MNGGVWSTFLVLLAVLIIGFEIGKAATARKVKELLNQISNMLQESAEKLRKDQEKRKIESAAKMDDLIDRLQCKINRETAKEGETFESDKNG